MKRWIGPVLAVFAAGTALLGAPSRAAAAQEPACKAAYLCEYESGEVVYAKDETKRLPIASMCKIMTLLLSFEAVDRGELTYSEEIVASKHAAGMGGSQVFLGEGLAYRAEALMKSVAVCSANDACVALAERIAGSEERFVSRMNDRAKELGAENTLFANSTGLPKEPQYSCAKDVSVMLREMLKHEKYFEFSKVWLEDFVHPDGRTTSMTNTNKLTRTYKGCDGGKTGFTNEAGFCLAATAKRGDTRLISVVIGEESSKQRFADVARMFDETFATFETKRYLKAGEPIEERAKVRGGKAEDVAVCPERDLCAFGKRNGQSDITLQCEIEPLRAPIEKGARVGYAALYRDGVEIARTDLLAEEGVPRASWWDAYRELVQNWN